MVHHRGSIQSVFRALADPGRLEIVERLAEGEQSVTALTARSGVSLQAVRKHLAVLEGAGIVISEKRGRVRLCRLGPEPLRAAAAWLDGRAGLWERRLEALGALLQEEKGR